MRSAYTWQDKALWNNEVGSYILAGDLEHALNPFL